MGIEYYIVKPSKQELFYLGKGNWSLLEGFKNSSSAKFNTSTCQYEIEPEYIDYEDYEELFFDLLRNEYYSELYVEQVRDLAYTIFEWCSAPVYIENDCSNVLDNLYINGLLPLSNFKETGSILDVWKGFKDKYQNLFDLEEDIDAILDLIPKNYWIKDENNVILSINTIVNYIKEMQNDRGQHSNL